MSGGVVEGRGEGERVGVVKEETLRGWERGGGGGQVWNILNEKQKTIPRSSMC